MRLLLDTHLLLWAAANSPKLSVEARSLIDDAENECFFSVASLWEIAIKTSLGRDRFTVDAGEIRLQLLANRYAEVSILATHALYTARLPALHKDPFDRLLVAQSLQDNLTLVTSDVLVASYSPAFIRV